VAWQQNVKDSRGLRCPGGWARQSARVGRGAAHAMRL